MVSDFNPKSYYTEFYFNGRHADGYGDYIGSEPILRAEFRRTIDAVKQCGIVSGKLLEVGCAYGFLLQEAEEDFSVYGVEISDAAVAFCHSRGLENVFAGVITEDLLEKVGFVDVVILLDVIEHLKEPNEVMELLVKHLRPGGVLLFTTGDWGSPIAKIMRTSWRLMTPPQHLWYFTRASVAALLGHLGLEIIDIRHPTKIVPVSLVAFQIMRMLGLHNNSQRSRLKGASTIGIPVNLGDAMRVISRKPS
jgi:2-polyprenyl-3-methyl-5-hydroxy-6-metoxy-1,4-benzoquinol methylase